jgi:uncharacterized membrane protein HdeD (DUF308 family)
MDKTFSRHWWLLAVRGIFALLFGVLTFIRPISSLFALVILFGAFALVGGAVNLAMSIRPSRVGPRWPSLLFEGIVGLVAGILTLIWPAISALALLMVIAVWSVVTGVTSIVTAIRLRKEIKGEWLLALNGVLSVALGGLLFLFPGPGALALVIWIGAYALVSGVLLFILAFRIRAWGRAHTDDKHETQLPVGRAPA